MKKHFLKLIRLKRIIVCPEMSHISERNLYKHRKGDFSRFNYSNLMRLSNPTVSEYYRNQFGFLFLAWGTHWQEQNKQISHKFNPVNLYSERKHYSNI